MLAVTSIAISFALANLILMGLVDGVLQGEKGSLSPHTNTLLILVDLSTVPHF